MKKNDLRKISEYVWEIPKDLRPDMKVPGRIFASERILNDILKDQSLEQVMNVAALPGIEKWSLAMPDIHEGYGMAVGGVAAFNLKEGIISPGGVGYDINCIHPETKINAPFGVYLKAKDFVGNQYVGVDFMIKDKRRTGKSEAVIWTEKKERKELYEIRTKFGETLKVTGNHSVYTGNEMVEAKNLKENDKIVAYPFQGVKYEEPGNRVLVDEKKIKDVLTKLKLPKNGNRHGQVISWLKNKELLPLKINSSKLPYLIKLFGYSLGDGVVGLHGKNRKGRVLLYGSEINLSKIKDEMKEIGLNFSVYTRKRDHKFKDNYGNIRKFSVEEYSLYKSSTALVVCLYALGMPLGNKTETEFRIPNWIKDAPLWQKRIFLAAFLGAEMSTPATLNKYNFYNPTLNINKSEKLKENGTEFLNDLCGLLAKFGIETSKVIEIKKLGFKNKTTGLRFQVLGRPENLIKLFSRVGFSCDENKTRKANLAIAYLRHKEKIKKLRRETRVMVRELYTKGFSRRELVGLYSQRYADTQFIEHSIWEKKREKPRIAFNFPSFEEFIDQYSFGEDGFVLDEIEEIKRVPYKGKVYDIGISHLDHNFIADGIVVSNCGVRIVRSGVSFKEIKDHIPKLTETLYKEVPSGVGKGGSFKLNMKELDKVLERGVEQISEWGYAAEGDLRNCESGGRLPDADSGAVSQKAKERGKDQLGTMGAGNHFVEIQRVDKIFDEENAGKMGLFEDGITIMIHCGSRGLGHQVATDYIRVMLDSLAKYGINLPDRQLACAPFTSPESRDYLGAMCASANFAWANRQLITHLTRRGWKKVFGGKGSEIERQLSLVYDVAHNIVKIEEYDGKKLIVHRKGATRSFPGQPVLIPGSMGTASYVLVGSEISLKESFGSSCHGAGRVMSRTKAKKSIQGSSLRRELEEKGISVQTGSMSGLAEEAPSAYKDIEEVIDVVCNIGLARRVARLRPVGIIKG